MDKKTIFSTIIIIFVLVAGYFIVSQSLKLKDGQMGKSSTENITENSPKDDNLPSKELIDEFIKIQTTVGLDGENIIDERIVTDGAEPRSMRIGFPPISNT